jgi:mRNA interferase MazF
MAKGDIVLIPFPFTDLTGKKLRPAVVLVETILDLTVCFITTQLAWQEATDLILYPNDDNGIKKTSLIRISKIATIDKSLSLGRIGLLNNSEQKDLNIKLRELLKLN